MCGIYQVIVHCVCIACELTPLLFSSSLPVQLPHEQRVIRLTPRLPLFPHRAADAVSGSLKPLAGKETYQNLDCRMDRMHNRMATLKSKVGSPAVSLTCLECLVTVKCEQNRRSIKKRNRVCCYYAMRYILRTTQSASSVSYCS